MKYKWFLAKKLGNGTFWNTLNLFITMETWKLEALDEMFNDRRIRRRGF